MKQRCHANVDCVRKQLRLIGANRFLKLRVRAYVPDEPELKAGHLCQYHDAATAAYFGKYRTCKLLSRQYYQDSMKTDTLRYISACAIFERTEARGTV